MPKELKSVSYRPKLTERNTTKPVNKVKTRIKKKIISFLECDNVINNTPKVGNLVFSNSNDSTTRKKIAIDKILRSQTVSFAYFRKVSNVTSSIFVSGSTVFPILKFNSNPHIKVKSMIKSKATLKYVEDGQSNLCV